MTYKIVVTDYEYHDLKIEEEVLSGSNLDIEFVAAQCRTPEEVIDICKDADGIINQYAPLNAEVLSQLEKCKVISRYGVGVDTIHLPTALEKGITVTNVPDYGIEEVSNHTVAFLLASSRKIVQLNEAVKNGVWDFKVGVPIHRFENRIFGVLGFGKIPRRVIEKVNPFGFQLVAYDPFVTAEEMSKYNVRKVELDEIIQTSDILSLHLPLTETTHHLINEDRIANMKDGVLIINTARGPIIKECALIEGVKSGKIAGAALDVAEIEPIPLSSELIQFPNVYLTPHSAFYSEEAIVELRTKTAKNIVQVLEGEKVEYLVK
ncbi:C-terminal binding protein [Ureibacillus chungkukjangi]|uniref:D-3-phosphoglycerate dehydrogenase n=1 Tax=Ureibacillus chungkukjangi TaxID=1202712 RepID=A0A318TKI1_9BACL|nr:C-terminal binding protein [Ureibacillus chungkukjangi]PYF05236.1 D-3-phosphoglycerate dehydrogenase [Ureibacillus chungkukjangi]